MRGMALANAGGRTRQRDPNPDGETKVRTDALGMLPGREPQRHGVHEVAQRERKAAQVTDHGALELQVHLLVEGDLVDIEDGDAGLL